MPRPPKHDLHDARAHLNATEKHLEREDYDNAITSLLAAIDSLRNLVAKCCAAQTDDD
jgi:hypothetical protein